jgi:hypothetical protein
MCFIGILMMLDVDYECCAFDPFRRPCKFLADAKIDLFPPPRTLLNLITLPFLWLED